MAKRRKRKLIEVAMPLDEINAASESERYIHSGHPSKIHLWWARRPLAACRAVLFAQLVDDPSSHPDRFPTEAAVEAERERLFRIIRELIIWENSFNENLLDDVRAEIRRSCGNPPSIHDPFSGGGSVAIEAQRIGLSAIGSDINPVAVLVGKATVEFPVRFVGREPAHPGGQERIAYRNAEGLAEDVRFYGDKVLKRATERIGHLYPKATLPPTLGGCEANVVAWLWSRTVPCPDPAFGGARVPTASTFLMSSKPGHEKWLEPVVDQATKEVRFRVRYSGTREEIAIARRGAKAARGANFRCLLSGAAITPDRVKAAGRAKEIGQQLLAIVAEGRGGVRLIFLQMYCTKKLRSPHARTGGRIYGSTVTRLDSVLGRMATIAGAIFSRSGS